MRKRSWILRPVSWAAVLLLVYLAEAIAGWLCKLGVWALSLLSGMTTFQIIMVIVFAGGMYSGLVIYALTTVPMLIVKICDFIYPSNHAFRYYFSGIIGIIGQLLTIVLAIAGYIVGGSMFWLYAKSVYLIIQYIIIMLLARESANERHEMELV